MFTEYSLTGSCQTDLNTEIRFLLATAKVDGVELVKFSFPTSANEKENSRIVCCVIKVMRTVKREGIIQFYVNREGFALNSTEASYLLNKFSQYIATEEKNNYIYVSLLLLLWVPQGAAPLKYIEYITPCFLRDTLLRHQRF